MTQRTWLKKLGGVLLLLALGCAGERTLPSDLKVAGDGGPATFSGRAACARCHPDEARNWRGSHHDLAMQNATPENVLGDFDAEPFEHFDERTELEQRGNAFFVRTPSSDGTPQEYRIAYTFGVTPLQQYLVHTDGGRLQALSVCWDTRPAEDGGQRWFHLYDEAVPHDDPLHWTGFFQNWNYMCASCHSTGLDRGYDAGTDRFNTTWKEMDVSCEACHGPGSRHVASEHVRTAVDLERPSGRWVFADGEANARLEGGPEKSNQTEVCARCHARRTPVARYEHGGDLHDAFHVSLLAPPLYHADGQILDEVYVYGSFLQSKMHGAGVTCSDCHDPHSGQTLLAGNALCTRCHRGTVYDVEEHHRHQIGTQLGTPGAACVDCHLAARTYMVVDPRRVHSFRVPRPDLSVRLGTPNACTDCHQEKDDAWAASVTAEWGLRKPFHYGEAFHAAATWQANASSLLLRVAGDDGQPAIVRASALAALGRYLDTAALPALERALRDPDPLVRRGGLEALDGADPATQVRLAGPLVQDPVRTVRTEAARLLAWAANAPDVTEVPLLFAALDDYRATLEWRADRPDTYSNLGALEVALGNAGAAEAAYRRALEMLPSFGGAAVNLADLYREAGRDADAEAVLRTALDHVSLGGTRGDDAALHHALGLALVRLGRLDAALEALGRAWELDPGAPRYAYVYGVALNDAGEREQGLRVLADAARRFPGDHELVSGYRALAASR
jgi:tetratricopeptide (TPR) repeat protein